MLERLIVLVGVVVGWKKDKEERKGRQWWRVEVKAEGRHAGHPCVMMGCG